MGEQLLHLVEDEEPNIETEVLYHIDPFKDRRYFEILHCDEQPEIYPIDPDDLPELADIKREIINMAILRHKYAVTMAKKKDRGVKAKELRELENFIQLDVLADYGTF